MGVLGQFLHLGLHWTLEQGSHGVGEALVASSHLHHASRLVGGSPKGKVCQHKGSHNTGLKVLPHLIERIHMGQVAVGSAPRVVFLEEGEAGVASQLLRFPSYVSCSVSCNGPINDI